MRSSDTVSTTSTLASSHRQSSLSSKLKGRLRTLSQSRSGPHGMPLIQPSGCLDSETSTLVNVNFGIDRDNLSSYILDPLSERESQGDSDLEEDNTAWSSRRSKKQKTRPHPAPIVSSRPGRDAPLRSPSTGTTLSNPTASARNGGQLVHSK
ncbi:hypothetical protein DAEQUDRAFT_815343 [Daedalea quercina L-15889]|uniref:Uncharacterized protein n=1 Tax=Daedalea quercina L-15889 TaxID=1314783 RepID=A0A165L4S2_9APHY|nr:hypothetical protein DAEQUDRAFT_815343 [Daedalea quercina L-15889]